MHELRDKYSEGVNDFRTAHGTQGGFRIYLIAPPVYVLLVNESTIRVIDLNPLTLNVRRTFTINKSDIVSIKNVNQILYHKFLIKTADGKKHNIKVSKTFAGGKVQKEDIELLKTY